MLSKNIPIFFIVASLMSTTLGLHHLVVSARRSLDIIMARQTDPADQCLSLCASANTTVASCTTIGCLCTTANAVSIQACVNCAIALDPSVSVVSEVQNIIDVFETDCATVAGIPSVTINTNPGTSQSTPTSTQSTVIIPVTTVSQVVIGPSSTTTPPQAASSVGSTSTAGLGGLPLKSSASSNKIILHWTVALLGLAAGNLMVF